MNTTVSTRRAIYLFLFLWRGGLLGEGRRQIGGISYSHAVDNLTKTGSIPVTCGRDAAPSASALWLEPIYCVCVLMFTATGIWNIWKSGHLILGTSNIE